MPDISMCANYTCPLRKNCYRYRAIPTDGYQTYADFKPTERFMEPTKDKVLECEAFWDTKGRKIEDFETAEERNTKPYKAWN